MTLQTTVRLIQADTAVVSFAGNLTMGMGLKVADAQIQNLIEKDVCRMVFDLTEVAYIDSAGLGTLVHAHGLAQQKNGMLRLCHVTDRVAGLLKLTGMDAVLPVDADATASLAAIGSAVT
jgi:anti-sigma B factor antagonist